MPLRLNSWLEASTAAKAIRFLRGGMLALTAIAIPLTLHADPLCINGHPAPRRAYVTYGGLPPLHGYERDHWWMLCAGGPDIPENVHYQRLATARAKDTEERELCEAICRGEISVDDAEQQIKEDWPLDAAHGYNLQDRQ